MSLKPNDLGDFQSVATVAENLVRLDIQRFIRQANQQLKEKLISSQLEIEGISVTFSYSITRFGGKRLWFCCPNCGRRVGIIYRSIDNRVGCKQCLGLKYRKQRFKGMMELGDNSSLIR